MQSRIDPILAGLTREYCKENNITRQDRHKWRKQGYISARYYKLVKDGCALTDTDCPDEAFNLYVANGDARDEVQGAAE